MKKSTPKLITCLCLISLTILSSCVNLAKRYKSQQSYWIASQDVKKYVQIQAETYSISETPKTATTPKDIFSLSPEGQAELIKALAAKVTTNPEDFISSLTKKLSAENNTPTRVKVFPTTVTKSIVFSVDRRWASEGYQDDRRIINRIADRLSNLEVAVNIPSSSEIKFNSWDKFVTDWVTVDLGKVTSSQQWSATANISATATGKLTGSNKGNKTNTIVSKTGKADIQQTENSNTDVEGSETNNGTENSLTIGPSANVNLTDKYETSLNLLLSRMKLSGTLSKEKMILRQEGAFGIDLSGNTSISVDYVFTGDYATPISVYKISKYYDNSNVAFAAATILKSKTLWIFPSITTSVTGTLQYKYLYRHVRNWSKKHIPEARQRVENYYGEVGHGNVGDKSYVASPTIDLVKPEDLKPVTFRIGTGTGATTQYIQWDSEIVNFETSTEAANFLEYLITLSKTTQTYGTITNIPANNNLSSFRVIKFQN